MADLLSWPTEAECIECGRVFDLAFEADATEFFDGHDCEAPMG